MGVDYLVCDHCGDTFPDCGEWYICKCGRDFDSCGKEFLEKYGEDPEGNYSLAGCDYCLGELVDDETLLEYLLKKYKLTKEKAIKSYKKTLK